MRGVVLAIGIGQTIAYASSYYLPAILAGPMAGDLGVPNWAVFAGLSGALVLGGLLGPAVGRVVDARGGRLVLACSSVLFAAGLLILSQAAGAAGLAAGWTVIGLAMACGLYDVAFSTLAGLFGHGARAPITGITLIAGFASTIGWPVTAWIAEGWGWRGACMAWAALHLTMGLLLYLSLPASRPTPAIALAGAAGRADPGRAIALLAFIFAAQGVVTYGIGAHLPALLMASGATPAAAIAAAALLGPAQVAARLAEFSLMRRLHPLATARIATIAHPAGAAALVLFGPAAAPAFALLHGGGAGMVSISKGALPLALFGPDGYGRRQGLIAVPSSLAAAAAPLIVGLVLEAGGIPVLLAVTSSLAFAALLALIALRPGAQPADAH